METPIVRYYKKLSQFPKDVTHMARKGYTLSSGPIPQVENRKLIHLLFFFWPRKTTYFATFDRNAGTKLGTVPGNSWVGQHAK